MKKGKDDEFFKKGEPEKLSIDLILSKNQWLTIIRWLYTFFIFSFFIIYNNISGTININFKDISLILLLTIIGNIIFIFTIKRNLKYPPEELDHKMLSSLATLQLDFDLIILSLLVFFSGGFESPVIIFFIFYIMVSTFLIFQKKAFRNTLTAMILVAVIFFTKEGLIVSLKELTSLITFNIILFFSYIISAYLSRNLKHYEEKLQELITKFREQSVTDGLTNLYNQAHFFLLLNLQIEKAKRYNSQFSLIMFDLDDLKNYNDNNGHFAGSKALKKVAQLMKEVFRSSDILAKYGGDEFVILLPNTDEIGAFLCAERLREMVENEQFEGREVQPLGKVTLSLGIATYPKHGVLNTELLNRSDKALYFAKETGKNKTVIYSEDLEEAS
jgi:diguanylate cyclase (GGDEF)-like protein